MKIAVVDNQVYFREVVNTILLKRYESSDIFLYESLTELSCAIDYDLLLLDINISNESYLSFAKRSHRKFPIIIFVTSYDDHWRETFGLNIAGYIRKKEIEDSLLDKIEQIFYKINNELQVIITTKNGDFKFLEKDIMRFYIKENFVFMQLNSKTIRIVSRSLTDVKKKVSNSFFSVNRNNLINVRFITCFLEDHILLKNESNAIKVARRKKKELRILFANMRMYKD